MKQVHMTTASKLTVENIAGFYIRTVTPLGNSGKVDCPKEHMGKKVYLVVISE